MPCIPRILNVLVLLVLGNTDLFFHTSADSQCYVGKYYLEGVEMLQLKQERLPGPTLGKTSIFSEDLLLAFADTIFGSKDLKQGTLDSPLLHARLNQLLSDIDNECAD